MKFRKYIKQASLEELCALRQWITNRDPKDKTYWILECLRSERKRCLEKNIPQSQWPKQLQGEDWEDRIKKKLRLRTKEEVKEEMGRDWKG